MDKLKDNSEEVIPKRGRGRPRTKPIDEEPKEKMETGRKTHASKHKECDSKYYRNHYQINYVQCPNCWKVVQKCKLTRHMRTESCFRDQISEKYVDCNIEKYIETNKEHFDNFCNYI